MPADAASGRLRSVPWVAICAALLALAACSANSGAGSSNSTSNTVRLKAAAPAVALAISPTVLKQGQSMTATWNSENATSCVATGAWGGSMALSNSTGMTVGPIAQAGTYAYGVSCTGSGGTGAASVIVTVGSVSPPAIQMELIPGAIKPGDSTLIVWSTTNAASCVGSSGTGSDAWQGDQPTVNSAGFDTGPIAAPGQYAYDLDCIGPGGATQVTRILTVSAAAPVAPPAVTFAAQSSLIQPGQSGALMWSAANASACSASGGAGGDGWSGSEPISSTGSAIGPIAAAGSYSYTLTCTGPGGSNSKTITLLVSASTQPPAVTVDIDISPQRIVAGGSASLTWSTANADACTASGSWSGARPVIGSAVSTGTLTTAGVYSYTLTCSGVGGSTVQSASVTVDPAPPSIGNFTATPNSLQTGQSFSLTWTTAGASSCTAGGGTGSDGWPGSVGATSGGTAVGPIGSAGNYTYSLICSGPGGLSAPRAVSVIVTSASAPAAAVTSFTATPSTLLTGQSTALAWTTTDASACTPSGGTGSDGWTGSVGTSSHATNIGPYATAGNYTYTLTCTGAGGGSAPVSVSVDVTTAPPAATITAFTATPIAVQTGQSTTLAWSSSNASSCNASGGTGSGAWQGAVGTSGAGLGSGAISPAGTYIYTLTCTGAGGASAPSSVGVVVTDAPPPPTIDAFAAGSTALQTGQSTSLSWSSSNASACTPTGGAAGDGWTGSTLGTSSPGFSVGPLTPAGVYTYTLTCTGAGGSSTPSSATVTVTDAVPPAQIDSFAATPGTIHTGQSIALAWTSSGATGCTASGGAGSDGWSGVQPTSSGGTPAGPINAVGTYVYSLVCTGPGGGSAPSSTGVTVSAAPAAASIVSFTATPGTIAAGQSTSLAWTSANATSCTASGGSGSDGWGGAVGASSAGTAAGPLGSSGTFTYTLTCTGAGGSSAPSTVNVTVNAPVPSPPTVTLNIDGAGTAQIQPNASPTLSWSSANATSCVASGGTGSDGWRGSKGTVSSGLAVGPIGTPGIYSYTLTCTGPGGSGSATVQLTVIASSSADCGVPGVPTTSLVAPAASVTSSVGGICLGCGVAHQGNLIDASSNAGAVVTVVAGVLGYVSLDVEDDSTSFPAGREAGFILTDGSGLLSLSLLQNVSLVTYLDGSQQEVVTTASLLRLQALGVLAIDPDAGYVEFTTTKPFDSVQLVVGQVAGVLTSVRVYRACVSLQ